MSKRIMCLVLSLVFCFGLFPTSAFAEDAVIVDSIIPEVVETVNEVQEAEEVQEFIPEAVIEAEPEIALEEAPSDIPEEGAAVEEFPETIMFAEPIVPQDVSDNGFIWENSQFPVFSDNAENGLAEEEEPTRLYSPIVKKDVLTRGQDSLELLENLDWLDQDRSDFVVVDGSQFISSEKMYPDDPESEEYKTFAQVMEDSGSVFATTASEDGDYYFFLIPAEDCVFDSGAEFVIFEMSVVTPVVEEEPDDNNDNEENKNNDQQEENGQEEDEQNEDENDVHEANLVAPVENESDAQDIADFYGIELIKVEDGYGYYYAADTESVLSAGGPSIYLVGQVPEEDDNLDNEDDNLDNEDENLDNEDENLDNEDENIDNEDENLDNEDENLDNEDENLDEEDDNDGDAEDLDGEGGDENDKLDNEDENLDEENDNLDNEDDENEEPESVVVAAPEQTVFSVKRGAEAIQLVDWITFPEESELIIGDGSNIDLEEGTVADAMIADGYEVPDGENNSITGIGQYYIVLSVPEENQTFEDGSTYAVMKLEVESRYSILDGEDQVWIVGSEEDGLTFRADGEFSDFTEARVDNVTLAEEDYEVSEGSTIITLKPSALDLMEDGVHTLDFVYDDILEDNTASVDFTTITPSAIPELSVKAVSSATKCELIPAGSSETIDIAVSMKNLTVLDAYIVKTSLIDAESGEVMTDKDGNVYEEENYFTSGLEESELSTAFTIDTSELVGKKLYAKVTMEYDADAMKVQNDLLWSAAPQLLSGTIAEADSSDAPMQVAGVEGELTVSGIHVANPIESCMLSANVQPIALTAGEYSAIISLFTVDDGEDIEAKTIDFTVEDPENIAPIVYEKEIDASELAGRTVGMIAVIKKMIPDDSVLVAYDEDLDRTQVHFPKFSTMATVSGSKTAAPATQITLTDTIYYENLVPGVSYSVKGDVYIIKDDGSSQQLITITNTFTPEYDEGSADINFMFDASALAGMTLAATEEISLENVEVGRHADLEDKDQQVKVSQITTKLRGENGEPVMPASEIVLHDTVSYMNLVEGNTYTAIGTLMVDGEEIPDVSAMTEFTGGAEGIGDVVLEYSFDASAYAGKQLTAFVSIYEGEAEVAFHKDLESAEQTVFIPVIETAASNGDGGDKIRPADESAVIDTISFTGLKPNRTYKVVSTLVEKDTEAQVATSETSFLPKETDGSADVVINFNANEYVGKYIVVYEEIYDGETMVAWHKDIDDDAQTVFVPSDPAVYKFDVETQEPLAGAKILIKDLTAGTSASSVTDDEGIAYFPLVAGHQYSYKETEAPEGYILNPNTHYFTVDKDGSVSKDSQTLYNYKQGTVIIRKADVKTGKPVTGATVTVYDSNGNTAASLVTDKFGQIYFNASSYIAEGSASFTYKETQAPSGYYLDSSSHSFTVNQEGKAAGDLSFVNAPLGTVTITKTDTEGHPLAGARLSIYTSAGRMIGQATTNANGHIYFAAPEANSYYFIEDQAPEGYARSDTKYAFAIDRYGRISGTTTFVNEEESGKKGVATGDTSDLYLYIGIFAAAVIITAIVLIVNDKRKKKAAGGNGDAKSADKPKNEDGK